MVWSCYYLSPVCFAATLLCWYVLIAPCVSCAIMRCRRSRWRKRRQSHQYTSVFDASKVETSSHTLIQNIGRRKTGACTPQSTSIWSNFDASRNGPFAVLGIVEAITSLPDGISAIGRLCFDEQLECFPVRRFHRNRFFDQKLGLHHLVSPHWCAMKVPQSNFCNKPLFTKLTGG